jgi:hypothetical protein
MTLSPVFAQVPSSEKVTRDHAQQEASLPLSELELVSNNAQSSDTWHAIAAGTGDAAKRS